jgi:hypothetical protein
MRGFSLSPFREKEEEKNAFSTSISDALPLLLLDS